MRRSAVLAAFVALVSAGCADLLGFKSFTKEPSGDASVLDAAIEGDASSDDGRADTGVVAIESGSPVPCTAGCGPGQTCENDFCVCDPSTCTGCCSGTACSTSWPGCGAGGGACAGCDSRTDRCDSNGACACGTGGPCATGQECVGGACRCDATSCSGTCCGETCVQTMTDQTNCGVCGHSCLGAACTGGQCVPSTLSTGGTTAWAIALSSTDVYWLAEGGLYSCPLAGCGAAPAGPYDVGSYSFDHEDLVAYDENGASSLVVASGTVPDDAGTVKIGFTESYGGASKLVSITSSPGGWFLDPTAGIYWYGGGDLMKREVSIGSPQLIIMTNLVGASAVAADANNVYVADDSAVVACPKATLNCGSATTLIASTGSPIFLATEPDSQFVYFGDEAAIYRCPYRGCTDPNNVPIWIGASEIGAIIADASAVYWTDMDHGTVTKCALGATCDAPITIASGLDQPYGIALDDSWVYWTLAAGPVAVQRAAK